MNILPLTLANLLQASQDFGFVSVKRERDCTGYLYKIEWLSKGGAQSMISISNAGSVTPSGTTVVATRIQAGGVIFNPISGDLTRTYHTYPQVTVDRVFETN